MSAKKQKRARSEYLAEGSSSGKRKKSEESEGRNESEEGHESEEGNELEESEDCKVFFLYFGVWRFGRLELTLKVSQPLTTIIGLDEDEDGLIPSRYRQKWRKWKHFIASDEEKYLDDFFTDAQKDSQKTKRIKREFKLLEDLSTHSSPVYMYRMIFHMACSKVNLTWWLRLYNVKLGTLRMAEAEFNKCCNPAHGNHEWLLPFFVDNKAMYLRNDLSEEMKRALDDAKASEERASEERDSVTDAVRADAVRDSVFSFQDSFFEFGSMWEEDQWSKRLYQGLERYLRTDTDLPAGKYEVNYVAKDGKLFHKKNDPDLYIFRGSPDILFTWYGNDTSVAVTIVPGEHTSPSQEKQPQPQPGELEDEDTSSAASSNSVVENMLQRSHVFQISGIPAYEKTGELIANLHILAVKKMQRMMQRMLKHEGTTIPSSITVGGILVDKLYGIIRCKIVVPIHDGDTSTCAVDPRLDISSSLRGMLEADSLCYHLKTLFENMTTW